MNEERGGSGDGGGDGGGIVQAWCRVVVVLSGMDLGGIDGGSRCGTHFVTSRDGAGLILPRIALCIRAGAAKALTFYCEEREYSEWICHVRCLLAVGYRTVRVVHCLECCGRGEGRGWGGGAC